MLQFYLNLRHFKSLKRGFVTKERDAAQVACFGGSFDPPHFGHLRIIESVLNAKEIDKLFLVPNFLNPFKSHFYFSPKLRLEWLRILCKESLKVWADKIEILDYEVRQNAPIPTYQTLQFIQQTYSLTPKDKMYLLVGADNVESLHKWQNLIGFKTM